MSLDENIINIEILLILFIGISYLFYKLTDSEVLRITTIILAILGIVGFLVLWFEVVI